MSNKYLIKKTYSKVVDESEMINIVDEYTMSISQNPTYAYKNNKLLIQFKPETPYKLEIEKLEE